MTRQLYTVPGALQMHRQNPPSFLLFLILRYGGVRDGRVLKVRLLILGSFEEPAYFSFSSCFIGIVIAIIIVV